MVLRSAHAALALWAIGCGAATTPVLEGAEIELVERATDAIGVETLRLSIGHEAPSVIVYRASERAPAGMVALAARALPGARVIGYADHVESDVEGHYSILLERPDGARCELAGEGALVIHLECPIAATELPPSVATAAQNAARGAISEARRRRGPDLNVYVVHARRDDRVHELELTAEGEVLRHDVLFSAVVSMPYLGEPSVRSPWEPRRAERTVPTPPTVEQPTTTPEPPPAEPETQDEPATGPDGQPLWQPPSE